MSTFREWSDATGTYREIVDDAGKLLGRTTIAHVATTADLAAAAVASQRRSLEDKQALRLARMRALVDQRRDSGTALSTARVERGMLAVMRYLLADTSEDET